MRFLPDQCQRNDNLEDLAMKKNFISPMRCLIVMVAGCAMCVGQQALSSGPAATAVAGTSSSASPADAAKSGGSNTQFKDRSPRYRIEAGDSFDVTFELSPEFNQTGVAVQPDGFVTLRSVGDLKVAGQTVPELTQTLKTAYSKILNDPVISVVLKEFEKPYFVADGQVAKPGKYEMHGNTTLTQAIAIAGGFQSAGVSTINGPRPS
jgi:polysaccharide export outer membrane protein